MTTASVLKELIISISNAHWTQCSKLHSIITSAILETMRPLVSPNTSSQAKFLSLS